MQTPRISELAKSILANADAIGTYLQEHNQPALSFDALGPGPYGTIPVEPEVEARRVEAVAAATELLELLQGPCSSLRPTYNGASLQAISQWKIAEKVPIEGEITYAELAQQCGVAELGLARLLRYAIAHHRLFAEPRPGAVAHSAYSRLLVSEPFAADILWLFGESGFACFPHMTEALARFDGHEPNHTAFALSAGHGLSFYEAMTHDADLASRFSRAMTGMNSFPFSPFLVPQKKARDNYVLKYPWDKMGASLVVDIGGCRGSDACLLAETFPNLRGVVVQDLPDVIAGAQDSVPDALNGRVSFVPYSFFDVQSCTADIYLIKLCFHNWPDHYCIRFLRNQIPALKSGARLVVLDGLLPKSGATSLVAERTARAADLLMLCKVNGRERDAADWTELFAQADERFKVISIKPITKESDLRHSFGIVDVVFDELPR